MFVNIENIFSQASNCNITISGKVIDEHDKTALGFAIITIKETGKQTVADENGAYVLNQVCEGNYTLICEHVGCEPLEKKVSINKSIKQNFFLEHHEELLNNIEIITKKDAAPTQSATVIEAEVLQKQSGNTLGDVLKEVSGVTTLSSGATIVKPVIHGLYGNRITIINNGIKQEDQQWGNEHAPNIDPFASEKITVIKGAAAVQYGADAIGGVVLIEQTKPTAQLESNVFLTGQSNGKGGALSASIKGLLKNNNWHYKVQGTLKRRGDLSAPNYMLTNTASAEQAVSAFLNYETFKKGAQFQYSFFRNELGILRSSHIGNVTDLREAIGREEPFFTQPFSYTINAPKQDVSHHLIKAMYYNRIKENIKLTLQYGVQLNERKEFDIRRGGRTNIPALDLWLQTHNVDAFLQYFQSAKWNGKAGINTSLQNNYNVPGTGFRPILPNYTLVSTGAFATQEYNHNKWQIEMGIRYDYRYITTTRLSRLNVRESFQFNFHNAAFTTGVKYTWNNKINFQTNISSGFRPPNVFELLSDGLHQSAATIEQGDVNLKSERNVKWMNTLQVNSANQNIRLQLSPYVNYINNYIYQQPLPDLRLTIRGAFPVFQYVQTDALISGIDVDFNYTFIKQLRFTNKTSFLYGRDLSAYDDLIFMPPVQFNNTLTLQSNSALQKNKPFIAINHVAVLQQYWYPEGIDFIPPPAGYQLLNIYTGITLPLKKHQITIALQAENILNAAYRDYLSRFRYFADNMGRNFSIKINYQFSHNPKTN